MLATVVIVEDEKLTREGLKRTVKWDQYGCKLIGTAADGEAGIRLILDKKPDIVITDIRMPKKSGLEMMAELQEQVECQFIILSGYDDFVYAKQALRYGASGYLLKPIDDRELEEILLRITERTRVSHKLTAGSVQKNEAVKNALCDKYLEKAMEIMKEKYMEELTLRIVADELCISESYLGKLFKNKTSYTFLDFLTLYRVRAAISLLEETELKVYEIAYTIGYTDAKYFSKVFQKIVGVKPTEYRNGYQLSEDNILHILKPKVPI